MSRMMGGVAGPPEESPRPDAAGLRGRRWDLVRLAGMVFQRTTPSIVHRDEPQAGLRRLSCGARAGYQTRGRRQEWRHWVVPAIRMQGPAPGAPCRTRGA